MMRRPIIGVVGAGGASPGADATAAAVGREIARHDAILVCGGLGGAMTAAARGAREAGGTTIGILPGTHIYDANPYIDIPIATGMGQARNAIIVQTAQVIIAIAGGYGTLSEIAMALKIGKKVIVLRPQFHIPGVLSAQDAAEAVRLALALIEPPPSPCLSI
jgi:uncharacterized protein (TIGR00725 family)